MQRKSHEIFMAYLGIILGASRRRTLNSLDVAQARRAFEGIPGANAGCLAPRIGQRVYFRPMPTRKVSEDFTREDLGLIGLTVLKVCLNSSTSSL